jgi:methionine-rich copper-binding protein CopC
MKLRSLLGAAALALVTTFTVAVPASAHAVLESSSPAENAALSLAPIELKLTFNEPVRLQPEPFRVVGRDGTQWRAGKPTITGTSVSVPVTPAGPAQAYTITYKIIADDGDNQTGTIHFTLTAPAVPKDPTSTAPTSAAPSAARSPGSGVPAWVWILVAVVLALAAGAAALRLARGRRQND